MERGQKVVKAASAHQVSVDPQLSSESESSEEDSRLSAVEQEVQKEEEE
jgi:hypothetical protein